MFLKHNIFLFYLFTLIFSVILGGMAQQLFVNLGEYQTITQLVVIQMAPLLGTIFVCLAKKDWSSWERMNWNPFKKRNNLFWILLSFVTPVAIVTIASLVLTYFNNPYISSGYNTNLIIIIVLGSLIGSIGEEVGWRGFMLPSFNKKYPLFLSSIFTGLLWGVWHFGKIASFGLPGYLLFILLITEFSIIMAWIYSHSNRNMFGMVLFHLGINLSSFFLLTNREGMMFYVVTSMICAVICLVIFLVDKKFSQLRNR